MSVANFSRWANSSSLSKKPENHRHNGSQSSLVSSTSELSLNEDGDYISSGDFGTLIIVVMKAKNLYNRRAISKQNPYCSVRVAKHSDRTKAITRGGQAPLWDHETRFKLNLDDDNKQLKLCVFDQNGSNTEIIGDALIPLKPAFDAPPHVGYDDWFPIHFNRRYVGEVYLEMTFYPRRKSSQRSSRRSSAMAYSSGTNSRTNSIYGLPNMSNTSVHSHHHLPTVPQAPHVPSIPALHSNAPSMVKHSESMPILKEDIFQEPVSRTPSPPASANRRSTRPLPRLPHEQQELNRQDSLSPPRGTTAQEDIQKQINDGYEASLLERLKPSASQPFS